MQPICARAIRYAAFLSVFSLSQNSQAQQVFVDTKTCLFGVKNATGGELLFAKYSRIELFPKGLIYAIRNGKPNYWLLKQEKLQPLVYDTVSILADSVFLVGAQGTYGLVHQNGQGISPLQYQEIRALGDGYLTFNNNKYGFLGANFEQILPNAYDFICPVGANFLVQQDKIYKLVSSTTLADRGLATRSASSLATLKSFPETEFLVDKTAQSEVFLACKGDNCSIFNQTGELIGSATLTNPNSAANGSANPSSAPLTNPKQVEFWAKNRLFIPKGKEWAIFDTDKKQFWDKTYLEILPLGADFCFYQQASGWGIVSAAGKSQNLAQLNSRPQILAPNYYLSSASLTNPSSAVSANPAPEKELAVLYQINPKTGVHTAVYQSVKYLSPEFLAYLEGDKWGILEKTKKTDGIAYVVRVKAQYEAALGMKNGFFKMQKAGNPVYIDTNNTLLPCAGKD